MRQPGEVRRSGGMTRVWLDQYSGAAVAIQDSRRFRAGDTVMAWQFPLHNGEAFGWPGRIIVFVSGFIPLTLYVTGLVIWSNKRKARQWRRGRAAD
jgi:uncharacterized iron-regulated membrane protein